MSIARGSRRGPISVCAFLIVAALLTCANRVLAAVIHVPADQPTIVHALDASFPGDEIVIETGTYDEPDWLHIYDTLTLTATNGPVIVHVPPNRDAAMNIASGISNVVINGLILERPETAETYMRSVQLNRNSSATFNNCVFTGPGHGVGAILFFGADGEFNGCTFSNFNTSVTFRAAVYIEGRDATSSFSNLILRDCTFGEGCAGWIKPIDSDRAPRIGEVTVTNCTFKAAVFNQGVRFRGGNPRIEYNPEKSILFQDCSFEGTVNEIVEFHFNTTNTGPAELRFSRCVFNAYDSGRRMFYLDLTSPITFENCLFAGGQHQTVVRVWGGPPSVDFFHCTMITEGVGGTNSTFIDGYDAGRTFNIVNSLFRCTNDFSPGFVGDATSPANRNYAIANSIIDHPTPAGDKAQITPGEGYSNVSLANAFVDESARDYHLVNGSPWIGGGDDLGYSLDLDRNPRNQGGAPDMGAFESPFGSVVAPAVSIALDGDNLSVTFTGVLQSAEDISGEWEDVLNATSPYSVSLTNDFRFWRARSP